MNEPSVAELADLRASVRGLLERRLPMSRVREIAADDGQDFDRSLWDALNSEVGLSAMAVPESHGGLEAGPMAMAVIGEELGRALAPVPFLSSAVLTVGALAAYASTDVAAAWLPRLAEGLVGTVVLSDRDGNPSIEGAAVEAISDDSGVRLYGECGFVPDAASASVLLVAAHTGDETVIYAVEPDRNGTTIFPVRVHDRTRRLCTVTFSGTAVEPRDLLVRGQEAIDLVDRLTCAASVALASDAAGGADRLLHMAAEYAIERTQFDRPIGSFQAVKHKLADDFVQVEGAVAASAGAARALADGDLVRARLVAAFARDAYVKVAGDAIQVHGGIGYTWEHDCHLFFKRAQLDRDLLGSANWHRLNAAASLIDAA
ncbi:acyl-CoA dehydrogenase family protein [Nocardia abscessus]|uniref:acyl-CoA dehydrogenase family protein n=1 Tax=Nocardia TaxID=1817 RepID=UPI00189314E1|nr:acyl-CoA dehydrogenase family protein [Nocardia abscessus]MBF6472597.1 acyl-CoA/acyl-ACP dehydrogenase [Nocardia abscessus]